MRIKTDVALRQVDQWRELVTTRYRRFASSLSFLLIAVGDKKQVILPMFFTIGLSLHFVLLEVASVLVLGALVLKLHSYRFANFVLRAAAKTN